MKALPLKEPPGTPVIGDHLGSDFSKLQRASQRHDLRTKTLAEASRAPVRGDVQADLTDFVCPSERIYMKTRVTSQDGVRLGQQSDCRAALSILDPGVDGRRIADVAA